MTTTRSHRQETTALIIANARVPDPDALVRCARTADLIIAADGGSRSCRELGIVPAVLIGDLDSTTDETLTAFRAQGVELHRYPAEKDKTDLELALDLALERGARDIKIYGALGRRWDMTLGNLMLLTKSELAEASVTLIDGPSEIRLLRSDQKLTLRRRRGDLVSLIPAAGTVRGVTLSGFEYPLSDHDIEAGSTLGISNVVIGDPATIELRRGFLFCVLTCAGSHP